MAGIICPLFQLRTIRLAGALRPIGQGIGGGVGAFIGANAGALGAEGGGHRSISLIVIYRGLIFLNMKHHRVIFFHQSSGHSSKLSSSQNSRLFINISNESEIFNCARF